jgi:CheY-like chemotaxis protein
VYFGTVSEDKTMTADPRLDTDLTRILLVEDDPDDIFLLTHALTRRFNRTQIEVAHNGREALDHLAQFDTLQAKGCPSLILLDLNMPFMDGYGLLVALRRDDVLRGLPAIVMTGMADDAMIRRAYHDGATAVVQKPQTTEDMGVVIDSIIDFWFCTAHPLQPHAVHV